MSFGSFCLRRFTYFRGSRVQGFRGSRFRVQGSGFKVQGSGFRFMVRFGRGGK
jgi:hypothetical protein